MENTNFEDIGSINTAVEGVTNNLNENIEEAENNINNIIAVEEITNNFYEAMDTEYNVAILEMNEMMNNFYETTEETENNINLDIENKITNNLSEAIEETENNINLSIENNPRNNLSDANNTLSESWGKHLFWPRPDVKKGKKREQIKLPFAVTSVKWIEHHAQKEKEKLIKEEELAQKRKQREEIQAAKRLKVTKPNKKKTGQKLKEKKPITKLNHVEDEEDVSCIYCNEPYKLSKSGEQWIRCCNCTGWAHELCAGYENTAVFECDMCL